MIEIVAIFLLMIVIYLFTYRKGGPKNPVQINQETNPELYKPDIIEDNSHLKHQLAQSQQSYSSSLHLIGQLQFELKQQKEQLNLITAAKIAGDEQFQKLQHQNKSSQVRTGALTEALLPLSSDFPCDPKTMRFLGSPIDYVAFEYEKDMITFVEVKSGESQLNSNQREVKRMVEEGKVQFKVVRLNEKGIKVK